MRHSTKNLQPTAKPSSTPTIHLYQITFLGGQHHYVSVEGKQGVVNDVIMTLLRIRSRTQAE